MTKEELFQEALIHKHVEQRWVSKLDPEACKEILKFSGRNFGEKMYKYLTGNTGECKICGKPCRFYGFEQGYRNQVCSSKCHCKQLGITSPFALPEVQAKVAERRKGGAYDQMAEHRRQTLEQKYGSDWNVTLPAKSLQTKLERYGTGCVNLEKRKQTCKERYGETGRSFLQQERDKILGTEHGFGSDQYRSWLSSQGVSNVSQISSIQDKKRKQNWKRSYSRFLRIFGDRIEPLFSEEEFKGWKDGTYRFRCKHCSSEFEYNYTQSDYVRCPVCYPKRDYTSYAQQEIAHFLESLGVKVDLNVRDILGSSLELDIFSPEHRIAIEYNGNFWHTEIGGHKDRKYHLHKTNLCLQNGIRLIQIFEDEWLLKQDIVKNRLRAAFGKSGSGKVYARHCIVTPVPGKVARDFLDRYHIQGADRSPIYYGAYYGDILLGVMSFGKGRVALGQETRTENVYELTRFATDGRSCPGLFSKILSRFIKEYKPTRVISFADRRWSKRADETVYVKAGFVKVSDGTPNYWYVEGKHTLRRYHRFSFRKSELKKLKTFDPELTEWENMQKAGYDRIWDCGSYKFELNLVK